MLMHMHAGRRAAPVPALARLVLRLASAPGRLSRAGTRTSGGAWDTHAAVSAPGTYRSPDSERFWMWLAKIEQFMGQLGHPQGRGILVLPEGSKRGES